MALATGRRRGRPATAAPADVLRLASDQYLGGQRVDLTVIAKRLRIGRATIYRWFGSREGLLGEVIARELEALIVRKRSEVRRRGAPGLLEVFDRINRALVRSPALGRLLEQERASALRLLTSSAGIVHRRAVASIERLIAAEAGAGAYDPPADPDTLAYAVVRLCEGFVFNDASVGIRGDYERLREVQAALLGVPTPRRRLRTPAASARSAP